MSRHGYTDDWDDDNNWAIIKWRGQVASSIRGKRGQKLLRDLRDALDAMPHKRLIAGYLIDGNDVCAIGCIGASKGLPVKEIDPYDYERLAKELDIACPLVQEIEWINDEWGRGRDSPESRWCRVRAWVSAQIRNDGDAR